mgnify:CR=1 FL=1
MRLPTITIASGNPKKVEEIGLMLGPLPIRVQKQPDELNVEETGTTYLENALLKAKAAAKLTKTLTIADDSGLEVDALNGAPGIYSARFAKNNEEKIKKLLNDMGDTPYRSARLLSVMVLCDKEGNEINNSQGICWGKILRAPAYPNGEFESLFWIKETKCTYGELNQEQLSKIGTRAKAARSLAPFLREVLEIN